jgi:Ser/Thr protein kinase RdoA (MazF antagonist)
VFEARAPGALWRAELLAEPGLGAQLAAHPLFSRVPALLDLTSRSLRDALPACPRGVCHGDFAPHNLLARADGSLAILDWDLADLAPFVWDLARALDLFAVRWSMDAAAPPALNRPRLRAFLTAYAATRPLQPAERHVLPILIAASRLELDSRLLTLLGPVDPALLDAVLPRLHARLSYAAAGAPELWAALQLG